MLSLALASLLVNPAGDALSSPPAAPVRHAVAYVNDFRSHGTVGDQLLSLDEAIRLHNGQLSLSVMSASESAQLSLIPGTGGTTDVTWIDIDGSATPTITIERDLTPIIDTAFGLLIKGFNESPVLDFSGPGITRGLQVSANSMALEDLILSGGPYGIDIVQTDVAGQAGATLNNVRFEGQGQFGIRVTATTPGGIGRVIASDCQFDNLPVGMRSIETGAGRTSIFELRNIRMRGVATGVEVRLGSGGFGRYTLDRLDLQAGTAGLRVLRPSGADRLAAIEGTAVRIQAPVCAVIEGSPLGLTQVELRLWELRAPAGGTALALGAGGDVVDGTCDELSFDGAVTLGLGGGSSPFVVGNWRGRNGTVDLIGSATQSIEGRFCRFDACAVRSPGAGSLRFRDSCFVGGSLGGTAAQPIIASACYVAAATTHVQQTGSLAAPQLGSMSVTPDDVVAGGTLTLQVDLPAGLAGLFVVGVNNPTPLLLPQPFHLYSVPAQTVQIAGVYRAQQSVTLSIPDTPALFGADLVAQVAVIPDPGMVAPPVQLPPGRRFVVQPSSSGGGG